MQAQTEAGIVDMLVCDYRGGELRGYVRHDAEGWPNAPARTPASPR
jgi:molecular chaperone Hsp33